MNVEKLISEEIALPLTLVLPEETEAIRSILLSESNFTVIATRSDADAVGGSARDIRTHIKAVREMGMTLRRPLKATQDRIKAIEDEYCFPLESRQITLENLVAGFARAEADRVAAEERKRIAELRRIESERIAAEEKIRQEKERIDREAREADEKLKREASEMSSKELFMAGMEAEKRRAEAEEAKSKADAALEKSRQDSLEAVAKTVTPIIAAHGVSGVSMRNVCRWEVTDEKALLKARPELFKIEIKRSAVNSTCFPNSLEATKEKPDSISVPGLTLWYEKEAVTRAY